MQELHIKTYESATCFFAGSSIIGYELNPEKLIVTVMLFSGHSMHLRYLDKAEMEKDIEWFKECIEENAVQIGRAHV